MTPDEIIARDKAEVAAVRNMIAPPGLVPEFPPNLAKARAGHEGMARIFPVLEGTVSTPMTLGHVPAEKIVPPSDIGYKAILYLHGWGFALGSIASHRHLVAQLAAASGAIGYCLDYRLSPEAPFPAAIEDGVVAYQALLASGLSPKDIVIAGDSSGGGLAVSTALGLKAAGMPQPAGLFLIYWAELYGGKQAASNPLASPVLVHLTGIAPMLIHVGSDEILLSDSLSLAHNAGLGVSVGLHIGANMPHAWHYMWPFLTAAREAIAEAGVWIAQI
jgi:epsilon-lactone hydrolase